MNRRKIQKVLNRFWQSGDNLEKEIIHIDDEKDLINDLFALYGVSHQRELLKIIFDKHLEETGYIDLRIDEANTYLDNF
tara:strand:+ start:608 stop:844 length:237 start_codon:yes stop_codon:yes gene_type:complete